MSEKVKITDDSFCHLNASELNIQEAAHLLTAGIAPRPIAFVSTMSAEGHSNLAPFSYFNAFGANPPVVAFSPARKGRDGKLKDTYYNLLETKECVIQMVNYSIVEQMSVASAEYPSSVDEFVKSGLTKISSHIVKPFRVLESPFQMECKLLQLIHFGGGGASGVLAACEVVKFHVNRDYYVDGKMQIEKLDHVGRNGGAYYTRAVPSSMFEIRQPTTHLGVGYDQLPEEFKKSHELSANDLGQLASVEKVPSMEEAKEFVRQSKIQKTTYFESAKKMLSERKTLDAWKVLLVHYEE